MKIEFKFKHLPSLKRSPLDPNVSTILSTSIAQRVKIHEIIVTLQE